MNNNKPLAKKLKKALQESQIEKPVSTAAKILKLSLNLNAVFASAIAKKSAVNMLAQNHHLKTKTSKKKVY